MNHSKYIPYIALAVGLGFIGPAHIDSSQNSVDSTYLSEASTSMSDRSPMSDQELAQKIRDKLGPGWISKGYTSVNVQVNNGMVTLEGTVKTRADKESVEKEVRNMKEVKGLDSELNVQDPSSKEKPREFAQDTYGTAADDQLNKKIRDTVSKGWLWDSYKDITLNTSDGVVTLEGVIGSMGDQQKLMKDIQKVDGVKSVKSNLRISNR